MAATHRMTREYWPNGLEDWTNIFDCRLCTFLKSMIDCEDTAIKEGWLKEDERLSAPMQESWESGDIEDVLKQRLDLLSHEERNEMERLVAQKLEDMKTRVLAWDPDKHTKSHIDIPKKYGAETENEAEDEAADTETPKPDHDEVQITEAGPDKPDTQQISEKLTQLSTRS
ncbi:Aminoglycoside phosphotransferase [Penicillium angulare]|uniref:Aminoglycoside phosphotransferase n=1 Tax=Penicillium angulare TaxID=116970 RepID=UPI002540AC97|nr:Aminoglycoside phosphotransferase [Penicillium angulare]KAJ5273863.1 Aminoglycoside phosphotransferase [Penicillium angulare]